MLRIKLTRVGKKKQPSYRVRVIERHKDPWGSYIENIGFYNPLTQPSTIKFDEERVKYWLSVGAQPTDTVHNLLVEAGIMKADKKNVSALGKKAKEAILKAKEEESAKKKEAADKAKAEKQAAEAAKAEVEAPKEKAPDEEPKAEQPKS